VRTSNREKCFPIRKFPPPAFRSMAAGGRTSKKRVAPSQIGPKSKKVHSEKPQTKDAKPSVVKRGRPVTLPQTHHSDASSDEEGEDSSEEGDAEPADEDEEMLDLPTKDPNGGCKA
jgi:pumilio family protein 6